MSDTLIEKLRKASHCSLHPADDTVRYITMSEIAIVLKDHKINKFEEWWEKTGIFINSSLCSNIKDVIKIGWNACENVNTEKDASVLLATLGNEGDSGNKQNTAIAEASDTLNRCREEFEAWCAREKWSSDYRKALEIGRKQLNVPKRESSCQKCDAEMLRVKMCEHIAEGEEGWNKPENRNVCPSTMAVAELRDKYELAVVSLRKIAEQKLNAESDHYEGGYTEPDTNAFIYTSEWDQAQDEAIEAIRDMAKQALKITKIEGQKP